MTMPVLDFCVAVGAAAVLERSQPDQDGAALHDALDFFLGQRLPVERPFVAAGNDVGRAVLCCEIIDRPHGVDHGFAARMLETEHQVVAVDDLLRFARPDLDRLGQVELVFAAGIEQETVHDGEDRGMDGDRPGRRRIWRSGRSVFS